MALRLRWVTSRVYLTYAQKLYFTKALVFYLSQGYSVSHALGLISCEREARSLKGILSQLQERISKGVSFLDALQDTSNFSSYFIMSLRLSQPLGQFEAMLRHHCWHFKWVYSLRCRWMSVFSFLILLLMLLGTLWGSCLIFLNSYSGSFRWGWGVWAVIFIVFLFLWGGLSFYYKEGLYGVVPSILLRVSFFRYLFLHYQRLLFFQTLIILLGSSQSTLVSLRCCASLFQYEIIASEINSIIEFVRAGYSLSMALEKCFWSAEEPERFDYPLFFHSMTPYWMKKVSYRLYENSHVQWLRWGRLGDWMYVGVGCVLGGLLFVLASLSFYFVV